MKNYLKKNLPRAASLKSAVAVQLMLCACYGWADQTDILNSPPFIAGAVKPNILFLMDDSGSMKRNYLPDQSIFWVPREVFGGVGVATSRAFWPETRPGVPYIMYGHYSLQCNHLAYNPSVVYTPPLGVDGKPLDPASTADFANPDYKPFYYTYGAPGTNPPMSFVFNADDSVNTVGSSTAFYSECLSQIGSLPGSRVFTRVNITSASSPAVKQNFQNWLTYYGNRREMMKTGVKQAFARVGSGYRVGFSLTSYEDATDRSSGAGGWQHWKFVNVNDFDADQKKTFFTAVDRSDGEADTPLRGALSKAGQYFANKAVGQSLDPMQQSCQRNFAILATDGGWTKPGEATGFGPYGVAKGRGAGPLLTQQDSGSGIERPFRDSGSDQVVSLADVAYYYYNTDLRRGDLENCTGARASDGKFPDICKNNVQGVPGTAHESFGDAATHQHMTTFTIGLGLNGRIPYHPDYRSGASAEFNAIVTGTGPGAQWTTLQDPGSRSDVMPRSHTDDLWHAAVNGHGQHFSATDPVSFVQSLSTALSMIKATTGAAGAAATTSNQPVAGDNDAYVSSFVSQKWIGDVRAYSINLETGAVDDSKEPKWSAKKELDNLKDVSKRKIFFGKAGLEFTAGNLAAAGLAKHFDGFCKKKGAGGDLAPAQCMGLTPEQLDNANSAEQLVNYLRGEQGQSYYRKRESRLGDIVNAGLLFVSEKPNFPYNDTSYINYKKKARTPVVLAGANDGMLHAFEKDSGAEKWAYVPKFVMKNMYKLADTNYPDNHVYSVDGTPQIGDVQDPTTKDWHTIVVGGLNAGGKGYYALDITDTAKPKVLWEFEHQHLGLTFGNPIITKRASGQWVVVFASGYNNSTSADPEEPKGDGNGRLFVLDALTGAPSVADPIPTLAGGSPVGRSDSPSGLAKINVWVDKDRDNTMKRVYGGDLLGNVWRFDIDGKYEPHGQALRLAQLRDKDGRAQPVTTKPVLAEIRANGTPHAMVYVGTGRYLGMSDLLEKFQVQSLYAFKDPLTNSSHANLRGPGMVEHMVTAGVDSRTVTLGRDVDLSSDIGWRLDFPVAGERVDINPSIALDTLYVAGNIPAPYTCQAGGSSFVYRFDLKSGKASTRYQGEVLVQGLSLVQITSGARKGAITTIARRTDDTTDNFDDDPPASSRRLKRASWRALGH